ncbi:cytochrome c oxidase subunit II [Chthonomonas calidirosea]|uniref:cytochrome c oxidase subunit II n=1 Tax=Chthonomonas calidirosea TaxID=454171 RepID=UPI0006ECB482|nr:cytochrome c oxidase subunit II [Chthonomonas calidirosea]CEK14738.1 cytochrome c oxidase, subunit II [Chthonomonas calidirosea]
MEFPIIPPAASTFADEVDHIFYTLVGLTIFFTALVFCLLLIFVVRFHRGSRANRANRSFGNLSLELTWSIIPGIIGLVIFAWSARPYAEAYNPPADAQEILVIGKRWMWHLQHADSGIRENNELHIPVGKAIKLTMISQDVIHGFYVPAFRVKRDCLPGYYNTVWFIPTKVGKYPFYCTEYCGTNHSKMGGFVYVMTPADYLQWKENGGNLEVAHRETAAERGYDLFNKYGCANCHASEDGVHGPTLNGLYGSKVVLQNGQTVTVDDNFIRQSIVNPDSVRVAGYPPLMQAYSVGDGPGQLSEEEILELIAYIKSLGGQNLRALKTTSSSTAPLSKGAGGRK